jgi:predicted metal-dependent peptidase
MPSELIARSPNAEEIERKRNLKNALIQCRAQFLLAEPFTASLAMRLDLVPVVDSRVPTACTDGESIFFSVPFCEKLSESERFFLIAHEVWHCAAGHFARRNVRIERLWNVAVDHEVNAILKRFSIPVPKSAVYFKRFDNCSAEQVYETLLNEAAQQGTSQGVHVKKFRSFDLHDQLSAANLNNPFKEYIVDSDFSPVSFSEDHRREWQHRIASATQEHQRQFGKLPGAISHKVSQILSPSVPWRELMRQFVQRCYGGSSSWLPPSRRHLFRGLYLPSRRASALSIAVAIDTSGSTADALDQFLTEVRSLLSEFDRVELTLICCDAKIQSVRQFTDQDLSLVMTTPLLGGGGTDFRPVFRYLKQNATAISCLVYLTDGDGEPPKEPPQFPVLWVLCEGGEKPTAWGETVELN